MHRLRRGNRFVSPDGTVCNVRLKRHLKGEKKISRWKWANNPFTGTREWNGLRVLMAIINNWDLKDANNAVYQVGGDRPEHLYMASDLGATFGTTGLSWNQRGNLQAYIHSKWIRRVTPTCIDFNVPSWPAANRWIGRNVPRADAKWIGHLLAQLSPNQIRDAFRAAAYSSQEVEAFSQVIERRIAELNQLCGSFPPRFGLLKIRLTLCNDLLSAELKFVQSRVETAFLQQLTVSSTLDYLTIIHDEDHISRTDGR